MEEKNDKRTSDKVVFEEQVIRTTPEDGFVPERVLRPSALPQETRGKFRKGYSSTRTYTTSDPRVTRPFVYAICGLFFVIGVIMALTENVVFGGLFIVTSVFAFVKSKKQIDAVAEKMKAQGHDVTIDSKEELAEIVADVHSTFQSGYEQCAKETFKKEQLQHMKKLALIIFFVVGIFAFTLLSVFVSVLLGIVVLLVIALSAFLYCALINHLEKKYND